MTIKNSPEIKHLKKISGDIIFNSLQINIFIVDSNDTIIKVNKCALNFVQKKEKQLIGCNFSDLMQACNFIPESRVLSNPADTGYVGQLDGKKQLLNSHRIPITNGKNERLHLISLTDKTKEKSAEEELIALAYTDCLTGLFNRRYFIDAAKKEIIRCNRNKNCVSFVMLDIDNFKRINDEHGHQAGDYILKEMAEIFKKSLRSLDLAARYGGEEFIIMLLESNSVNAHKVIDRLREKIEKTSFIVNNKKIAVTMSMGITDYSNDESVSLKDLIGRADKALYEAKNTGRNKVISWGTEFCKAK